MDLDLSDRRDLVVPVLQRKHLVPASSTVENGGTTLDLPVPKISGGRGWISDVILGMISSWFPWRNLL